MAIRTYTDSLYRVLHGSVKNTTKKPAMAIRTYTDFLYSSLAYFRKMSSTAISLGKFFYER